MKHGPIVLVTLEWENVMIMVNVCWNYAPTMSYVLPTHFLAPSHTTECPGNIHVPNSGTS